MDAGIARVAATGRLLAQRRSAAKTVFAGGTTVETTMDVGIILLISPTPYIRRIDETLRWKETRIANDELSDWEFRPRDSSK